VKDAEWIADLLKHDLVRARFVLDRPLRELRNWYDPPQSHPAGANMKLSAVARSIVGVSGRAMLEAMIRGS
jgi:transposase